jgi:hypothetical protein
MIALKNYIYNKINTDNLRTYETDNGICVDIKRDCGSNFHDAGVYLNIGDRLIEGDIPTLSEHDKINVVDTLKYNGFTIVEIHHHEQDAREEQHIHFKGRLCKENIDFIIAYLEEINNNTKHNCNRW